jgi:deoxycytidylate deaminase
VTQNFNVRQKAGYICNGVHVFQFFRSWIKRLRGEGMSIKTGEAISGVYSEANNFLIIGLTGRTGSGCSTAASKLGGTSFEFPAEGYEGLTENELKKHKIVHKYLKGNDWTPFYKIEVRSLITYHLLLLEREAFISYLAGIYGAEIKKESAAAIYDELNKMREEILRLNSFNGKVDPVELESWMDLYFSTLPRVTESLRNSLGGAVFTKLYQESGDNIRSSGLADSNVFDAGKLFYFPKHLNFLIKLVRKSTTLKGVPCRVVIDAIRNPYEAFFLKRRYANFYLISVNTPNSKRMSSLHEYRKLSIKEITDLDNKEYPGKISGANKFIAQNIQACIEIADVHVHNSKASEFNQNDLISQLAWYLALMMHPGLVMPTSVENCMQIAYTVKQSSGCISRQVGAVVTDNSYSVKSVGWNSTPQGQTPCLLRSAEDLLSGINGSDYSEYEKNDNVFRKALSDKYFDLIKSGATQKRNIPFCFKALQNEIEGEKNQVHTRSLHAEENAFLQIAKFGGQKLLGGVLFTTASPCELCAKKAYQLGVTKIIYIDPYPGIATDHILSVGAKKPMLELFRGAVGRAFYQLYQPLMPYKDELELLYDIPSYHNPESPSKNFLMKENKKLLEQVDALKAELRKSKEN